MERREFLKKVFKFGLVSYSAVNFGCDISGKIDKPDTKTVILYGTHYGSTKETAFWIAEGIETHVDVINIEEADFNKIIQKYNAYVLGSGIWIDGIHKELKRFLISEKTTIDDKVMGTFVVCGSQDKTESGRKRIQGYLDQINNQLTTPPRHSRYFGGRLIVEQLTPEDHEILEQFYRIYLKKEMTSWNHMEKSKTLEFGRKISKI